MRWVLRGIALIVLLAVGALLVRIVPAHLQIRRVRPSLPSAAELRALHAAPGGPTALAWLATSSQPLARGEIVHSVFLPTWPDGSLFEVDAGMEAARAIEFGELLSVMSGGGPVSVIGTVPQ